MHRSAQLAVDNTMRSALTADGMATSRAAHTDGLTLARARTDKERKCHELMHGEMCQLVVMALERGGRWSAEAVDFIYPLAGSWVREAPPLLRGSAFYAWHRRWTRLLSVSCARAFASSLVCSRSETPEG